ncbi:helix-turn-helix psq domain [Holotrichia oblita]|uniref:Helix-turn-helix psq domain n=1 Tax=Holotrichia oblita TaxID=644536 RepID=A0ACB9TWH9_HOLOL|nr:helix-turn-helix psq domain [Holotrichia oblita]
MGRYKSKTDRQNWSEDSMARAVQAVLDGDEGYRKASANFGVPQTTLERRVKNAREQGLSSTDAAKKGLGRYKSVFSKEQEQELVQHISEPQRAAATSEPTTDLPSTSFTVSPSVLRPPPREEKRIQNRNDKRRGKTVILTSSPYKKELQDEEEDRKKKKAPKKTLMKDRTTTMNIKENKEPNANGRRLNRMTVVSATNKIKRGKGAESSSSEEEEEDSDEACIFCNELYSDSKQKEGWIQCSRCSGWAHETCSNAEEDDDTFECDFCKTVSVRQ